MERKKREVRVWSKRQTQQTIRDMRRAGYNVGKLSDGFYKILDDNGDVWSRDGVDLFCAMVGTRGYLVSYHPELFSAATDPAQNEDSGPPVDPASNDDDDDNAHEFR